MKSSDTSGCRMSVVLRQFTRNCLHCCKPFHSYTSRLEIPMHMVVSSSYLLSEVLSVLAILNLLMQKKITDFSKLPFMLTSTLDHLNSSGRVMLVGVLQL